MTSTSGRSSSSTDELVERLHRSDWGRLVSLIVTRSRRLDLAEDAVSEAFAVALRRWPAEGVPSNPVGWLYTAAHRALLGRLRAEAIAGRKAPLLAVRPDWEAPPEIGNRLPDDRLHLIVLCCHPALSPESQSALALRLVIGTSTEQVARLFLVPTPTMAARLTRAKRKIATAGIPLGLPVADELRVRLDEVCRTIYLAFTAGYTPGTGDDLLRAELAGDAVELASVLHDLVPDADQVTALLALVTLQHARRHARQREGALVTLPDQDRSLWPVSELERGLALASTLSLRDGYAAELRLQALIAAEHAKANSAAATDWLAIVELYAELERRTGSPVVRLNRAVAVAEVYGPKAGLDVLDGLDGALGHGHRLWSVRAELAVRSGDVDLARSWFQSAIELCGNTTERAYLTTQLDRLSL